ncbi:5'-nucleotidase C-terminal domain-containing protein [Arthrobacter sp. AL08]|uniref:bifunctional metallophosphatase/5'-nucleotidase n=1 Tax=Micrococcaceae TaxID=1268 RepID=UPI00249B4913|nr:MULTISPECIES: 5'-nucleotidase C-terminal domain-containing protein [Micrococcaceae]MDI3241475.1 5'-nucleotidase C-terminal domain-containing protein [Arthrobacter sp. AL05]MDI3277268.1 5'-nucleotidase C-terminal domain-containing protein [Arthrobacter sp. AL08]MDJ0352780.1 5'-nucleotidase C-terminal domain-containing protein [Pseudarthrobacter sp. PH31-O2]
MTDPHHSLSRRTMLTAALVGGSAAAAALSGAPAAQAAPAAGRKTFNLTVLGTTDLHNNVFNWDYFKNVPYADTAGNKIGIAQAATLIKAMRDERGASNTLTIDAGDTIQGTPLAYYFAKISPISATVTHPMALAMNAVGYDAVGLGNHEFNYGIPLLRTWESQLNFPLLGANVHDATTGKRAFTPYVLKRVKTNNGWLTVGLVGFVTPGCALWDRDNVQGKLDFNGIVEEARTVIPQLKAAGADVVIVTSHSGATPGSSYGDALPFPENASTQLAEEVPGIDAILVGHAHLEIPERFVTNKATGRQVLLTEPLKWGMRVAVMDLEVAKDKGRWTVTAAHSHLLDAKTVDADPAVVRAVQAGHEATVKYVNEVIGTSTAPLNTATACWEDSAAIDAINYVQASTIKAELAGGPSAGLPVLSIAAAFSRSVDVKAGPLTIRDVAGLYIFDNTLLSVKVTGAQVRDYLEWSARYFKPVFSSPARAADVTNAATAMAPGGTPDYNYDVVYGLDAALNYEIDLAKPVGERITGLRYGGEVLRRDQEFALAINNYRQSGGGNFPAVMAAPVLSNSQQEIRQRIIDYVVDHGTLDVSVFSQDNWRLTVNGAALTVTA